MTLQLQVSALTQTMPPVAKLYNGTGSPIPYGSLLYISSWNVANQCFVAALADNDIATGRAQFVAVQTTWLASTVGQVAQLGQALTGILDTSGGAVGDPVYLGDSGAMTLTAPTGANRVEVVGRVAVVSATVGVVQLTATSVVTSTGPSSGDLSITGTVGITSASATAFAVGLTGATNPAFDVDASTALQVAGLKVVGAVHNGTVALVATDSSGATNLTINALSTGTIGIGSVSTGRVTITPVTTITGLLTLTAGITGTLAVAGNMTGTGTLTLGAAAGTNASIVLTGSTSGTTTIQCAVAAGAWAMTLPAAVGMAGQQLTDAGGNGITSWAAASFGAWKNDLGILDPREALARVLKSPTHHFTYNKDVMPAGQSHYDGAEFMGIFAEEARWAMHGLDDGKSGAFSPVNAVGYLRAAVEALYNELQELKGQRQLVGA